MSFDRLRERAQRLAPTTSASLPTKHAPMPGLTLLSHPRSTAFESSIYEPVFCLILSGGKATTVGDQSFSLSAGKSLLVSHDLPVRSRITGAPYLSLLVELDLRLLRTLVDEGAMPPDTTMIDGSGAFEVTACDAALVDALDRYLMLASSPHDARVLGPLVRREIHYRILTAPHGAMLRHRLRRDSQESGVARAIDHLRRHFRSPVPVPDLARRAGMSPAAFHRHFKAVTRVTPLQYQKDLRLIEARALLRAGEASVSSAAFDVGYESPSQFSREYARKFGLPPGRDRAVAIAG